MIHCTLRVISFIPIPAAASHTEMNIAMSWVSLKEYWCKMLFLATDNFHLMEVDSLRTLRYCKMSGMDIKRRTLRKRRPVTRMKKKTRPDEIQGVFCDSYPPKSSKYKRVNLAKLGVTRTIYVNVDRPRYT